LSAIKAAGLELPGHAKQWIVDCKSVGSGEKAWVYLGRYLYRGVIRDKASFELSSAPESVGCAR